MSIDKNINKINNLTVRKANLNDSLQISDLYKNVWDEQKGKLPDVLLKDRQPDEIEMINWLKKETYFVAVINEKIIGIVGCFMENKDCKLIHMVVLKLYRGQGIGSKLLDTVTKFAIKNNALKIWLDTNPRLVKAIKFYESYGFEIAEKSNKHFLEEDIIFLEKIL
jgi:ribosomal protein S18 acetylase RimI-like enzyme